MRTRITLPSIVSILLLGLTVGADAQENRGGYSVPVTIPTGQWEGTGTFLDSIETQAVGRRQTSQPASLPDPDSRTDVSRSYRTSLKIERQTIKGMELTVIVIESLRGKTHHLDDEATRVRLALRERSRVGDNVLVLETVSWDYDPDLSKPVDPKTNELWVTGTCMVAGDAVVLHIYHMVPDDGNSTSFVDTFVFRGDQVVKSGSIIHHQRDEVDRKTDPDKPYDAIETRGIISWTETLTRSPQ